MMDHDEDVHAIFAKHANIRKKRNSTNEDQEAHSRTSTIDPVEKKDSIISADHPMEPATIHKPHKKDQQHFIFTRHLRSCNNMINDRKMGFFSGLYNKFREPELSVWGVVTGLLTNIHVPEEITNTGIPKVYVSCLLRTWLTAIIKYLPHSTSDTFTLIVSPYIKEKDVHKDYGNMPPKKVQDQIDKFHNFFAILSLMLLEDDKLGTVKHYGDHYGGFINKVQNLLSNLHKVRIQFPLFSDSNFKLFPKPEGCPLQYGKRNQPEWSPDDKDTNEKLFEEKELNAVKSPSINYFKSSIAAMNNRVVKDHNKEFDLMELSNGTVDVIRVPFLVSQPNYELYYKQEGLFLFMKWVREEIKDSSKYILAICHSDIMQQGFVKICNIIKPEYKTNKIKKDRLAECFLPMVFIKPQNMWDLRLQIDSTGDIDEEVNLNNITVNAGEDPPTVTEVTIDNKSYKVLDGKEETFCGYKPKPAKSMFSFWRTRRGGKQKRSKRRNKHKISKRK